ncbi:MAG: hypothetical protein UR88_C0004G0014 [Candidatus Nomurabacteria bacterium GW2011_GWA1_35_8]|uniref:Endoribonuclease YbeY n=1 Tax=Candidatus Nomurabacteria bacterium GW2011_GWA1_35_8 TaxID=1618727 RepID=A0A0G0G2E7_9BACT|nr:MAG: hypothetical protein UR88_C0004G0014 [Candidatus Nomurabacteria bacterium GW2011_GWA1_35_8]
MSKIAVISLEKRFGKFERPVFSAAAKLLKTINNDDFYLEIYLAGDKSMKFLNKKFRNKNKAANVLSFDEPNGFPHPELAGRGGIIKTKSLGEIYLNMTNNLRPITDDIQLTTNNNRGLSVISYQLLVHGLLHLLGYNHKKKNDRIKMEKKEKLLINKCT